MYEPSIDILQKVIEAKNQKPTNSYKYLIIIRNHVSEQLIIDHIISTLLSHMHVPVFIGISTTTSLFETINKKIFSLCSYINLADGHDIKNKYTDLSVLTCGISYFRNIDAKYVLWHSASEYYCREVDPDLEIVYKEKTLEKYDENNKFIDVFNKHVKTLNQKWMWWPRFISDNNMCNFFIKNEWIPKSHGINGVILRKDIMMGFIDSCKSYKSAYKTCETEIMPYTYATKYYEFNKFSLKCDKWTQKGIIEYHDTNVKNGTVDYFTIKRIDVGELLSYLHSNYVEPKLIELGILSKK